MGFLRTSELLKTIPSRHGGVDVGTITRSGLWLVTQRKVYQLTLLFQKAGYFARGGTVGICDWSLLASKAMFFASYHRFSEWEPRVSFSPLLI